MLDLVTLGESMVAFIPDEKEYIRYARSFSKKLAGAESNVAIGVSKLGHKTGWISKVGKDELGEFAMHEVRGEGVDTSQVKRIIGYPTGVMFKQVLAGNETSVIYYRNNSAASTMKPEDVDVEYVKNSKIFHVSGITLALSQSCRDTVEYLMDVAKENGIIVSFDPNIRLKLWSAEEARRNIVPIIHKCDIVMIGIDEGELLFGINDSNELIEKLLDMGVKQVAVKLGSKGALVADKDHVYKIEPTKVMAVDNIGAGDAFCAGFLTGVIENKSLYDCGRMGSLMGAFAVSSYGDIEGLPDREVFDRKLNNVADVYR